MHMADKVKAKDITRAMKETGAAYDRLRQAIDSGQDEGVKATMRAVGRKTLEDNWPVLRHALETVYDAAGRRRVK
jgi:hypothetical protein